MCSHIPDGGEQMVRYYNYYYNVLYGVGLWAEAGSQYDRGLCFLDAGGDQASFPGCFVGLRGEWVIGGDVFCVGRV